MVHLRILHVITGLAAGGAEQQLRLLLPHLTARCEVAALTNPGIVAESMRSAGFTVHHLGMRGNRDLSTVARLARLMKAGRYEVVHTHLYRACVYGRLAARLARVPAIVATEHSIGDALIEGRRKSAAVRALYLASERLGQVTVAVSDTVAERLAQWGVRRSRIEVIANGIDGRVFRYDPYVRGRTRTRLGLPQDAFVVGGVGRLDPGKRFDLLLDAVKDVPDAFVLLVGAGPERPRLEDLARDLGVESRVVFAGESTGIAPLLSAMDVLAAPSREETFGLAVLEGLAAGLPVLYTTCPALDDLAPSAAPGARRLPPDRERWCAELRALAAARPGRVPPPDAVWHYDIRRQAEELEALYERLLARVAPINRRPARKVECR